MKMSEAVQDIQGKADRLYETLIDMILREAKEPPIKKVDLRNATTWVVQDYEKREDVEIDRFDDGTPWIANIHLKRDRHRYTFYIAVDSLDRSYGGPEEGGWWYDTGTVEHVETVRVGYDEDGEPHLYDRENFFLQKLAKELLIEFGEFNTDYRNSMRPSGQDYQIRITQEPPQDWPENEAHYC